MPLMDLQAVISGTQESRVEALRQILEYPLKQRDPEGSRFWFLRPGADEDEAEDTCPIAVGFYAELDGLTNDDIKQFLTADEQQREIYGHYTGRIIPNQPVMYLLLPEALTPNPSPVLGEGGRRETDFNREDAWELLPETNPFLRRLFRDVLKAVGEYAPSTALRGSATALQSEKSDESPVIADELIDAIAEVVSILRAAKMDAILEDFRAKMNREDIVIRFYEDFLAAYKPQMRERRGVYYTPEPVVSYMVRSVDILLKEKFNKPLGLADPEVMIFDPAYGTGTFLLWIFQLIHQRFQENPDALTEGLEDRLSCGDAARTWSGYVKERLLPRIFGFELLMAPYAIAHLKLGLFLEETGYQFNSGKRLGVYLTNTLDEAAYKSESLFEEFIAEESNQASAIKRDLTIMVVVGNPPYSGHSANSSPWIANLVRDYYQVDGKPLGEKNPKWLQDDYVKFLRFSQWRIDRSGKGILAFVTNHSFLDNPTFRGMRESLANCFDTLYVYDLHGNSKKREKQPNGMPDENVFDIQQGVSITLGLKDSNKAINHCHLYGDREFKYSTLSNCDCNRTVWTTANPQSPFYLFFPQDGNLLDEYNKGVGVTDLIPKSLLGFQTHRDPIAISYERETLLSQVKTFLGKEPDSDSWNYFCREVDYRPFDKRFAYLDKKVSDRPRLDITEHLFHENFALNLVRQTKAESWNHVLISEKPTPAVFIEVKDGSSIFPIYLYSEIGTHQRVGSDKKYSPNISQRLLNDIAGRLGLVPSVESIFYYIYAILHSPSYRIRYVEFLKLDFPKIPFTCSSELFSTLTSCGEELVALHLMKSPKLNSLITQFEGDSNLFIDAGHPKYLNGKVIINKKGDGFTGVPEEVWNFYVGGYQVCQKWLKDRKGRTLSPEDITHYQRIVVALQETIRLMQQIDVAIPGWPLE